MDNNKHMYKHYLDEASRHAQRMSLRRFRKEATAAWWRAHPHGFTHQLKPTSPYNAFVREHMPCIMKAHPKMSRADAMRAMSEMWRAHKQQKLMDELDF
jgi:hypothetical protein